MINSCTAQETRQKQLGRINTNVGPSDKRHPNLGVGIPINIPGEEPHQGLKAQFPWIFFSGVILQ